MVLSLIYGKIDLTVKTSKWGNMDKVWIDRTIKTIWDWANTYEHEISDIGDYTLVEDVIVSEFDKSELNGYLKYNGHSDYLDEDGMEELEEQVEMEFSLVENSRLGQDAKKSRSAFLKLAYLTLTCVRAQMGTGKTPVHPVEKKLMKRISSHLHDAINYYKATDEQEKAYGDFYERFGYV